MAPEYTLPLYVNDPVIESYDLPLIGRVEIRQFAENKNYFVLMDGVEFDLPENIDNLDSVKKSLEQLVIVLAEKIHKKSEEEFGRTNIPFLQLKSLIGISDEMKESWLDHYKEKEKWH